MTDQTNQIARKQPPQPPTRPDCPYLAHKHCRWLSDRFGQVHYVSSIACQFICRYHGPFAGRQLDPEAEAEFTAMVFDRRYNFPDGFLHRVLSKYSTHVRIAVPEQWPAIRQAMAVVENEPWFDGVGLTGSLIVDGMTSFKDYDIVLFVRDFEAVARDKDCIEAMLPDHIDGIQIDYFFVTEKHLQFFVVLSPDEGKLYASRWFRPKVELADGLELVASDNPICDIVVEKIRNISVPSELAWNRIITRQGNSVIVSQSKNDYPCPDCEQQNVCPTWEMYKNKPCKLRRYFNGDLAPNLWKGCPHAARLVDQWQGTNVGGK